MLSELFDSTLRELSKPGMFNLLPSYDDREQWESIDPDLRRHIVGDAEKLIGYRWPRIQASDYREYYSTGSRKSYDKVFKEVFDPLTKLAMAECVEGKGRFIEDLANGIFARCEDTSWVHTGHLNHHGSEKIPRDDRKYLDLRCCSTGKQLAVVHNLLSERLREYSPVLVDRMEKEIEERILDIFLETDQWWTNLIPGYTINNWNTHCNHCIIATALIMEKDEEKLRRILEKSMRSLDVFLSIYKQDGACNEGPGYWKGASLVFLKILRLISKVYSIDFSEIADDRIRNMGNYIYKMLIHEDWFMSYADGNGKNPMLGIKLYLTGKTLDDEHMQDMALDVFRRYREKGIYYEYFMYVLYDYIEYALNYNEVLEKSSVPNKKSYYLEKAVLPDAHIFAARTLKGSEAGFFIGLKGGNNDESHNHNDIGCPYVYMNGEPMIIDAGAGTYTIKTFSPDRYDIWTMQSQWHSLPMINGFPQAAGVEYKSGDFEWHDHGSKAGASMEISGAYPSDAGVREYRRSIELNRRENNISLVDDMVLAAASKDVVFFLTLMETPVITEKGIILSSPGGKALLRYDSDKYAVSFEEKDLSDDQKLYKSWGNEIYRLRFDSLEISVNHHFRLTLEIYGGADGQK